MSDLLFVYGTLRKGNNNAMASYLAEHAEFVSHGWFQGCMFQISYYPGVIASENSSDRVYGDIYKLHDAVATLKVLDDYEECSESHIQPAEYTRVRVPVDATNGAVHAAVWIYIYQWPVDAKLQIKSGDFMQPDMRIGC